MTSRREFIKTGVAASALIAAPAILRAQTREPFVMMTPFGFIADFIEMMNAISGGHMAAQPLIEDISPVSAVSGAAKEAHATAQRAASEHVWYACCTAPAVAGIAFNTELT